jgi:acyl-CoA thioesterase FadM
MARAKASRRERAQVMNLFFRFLRIFLPAWFSRERTAPLDTHIIKSAVWIGDHDPMGHMTNSRYASFTDLGMLNYIARTGFLKVFRKHGWTPIIQSEAISFHRMMRFPQKFELHTRPVGWEGSYILFEHKFLSKGRTVAESRMVARLVGRKKERVTIDMVFDGFGMHMESPEISPAFRAMLNDLEQRP